MLQLPHISPILYCHAVVSANKVSGPLRSLLNELDSNHIIKAAIHPETCKYTDNFYTLQKLR